MKRFIRLLFVLCFTLLVIIGIIEPVCRLGRAEYSYEASKIINPSIRSRTFDKVFYELKPKRSSKKWLSRIETIDVKDVPSIDWLEDTLSSKGVESFYCLDQFSDDCRCLLHKSYDVPCDKVAWKKSHFTGNYFFKPECAPMAKYKIYDQPNGLEFITGDDIDTWIYLPSKERQPSVFSIEFDFIPRTIMQETLQISFAMESLADRFRFVLENNKTLKFDIVEDGFFCMGSHHRNGIFLRFRTNCHSIHRRMFNSL